MRRRVKRERAWRSSSVVEALIQKRGFSIIPRALVEDETSQCREVAGHLLGWDANQAPCSDEIGNRDRVGQRVSSIEIKFDRADQRTAWRSPPPSADVCSSPSASSARAVGAGRAQASTCRPPVSWSSTSSRVGVGANVPAWQHPRDHEAGRFGSPPRRGSCYSAA